jgi:CxxC motif-containing protein (DUF1111 family)
MGRRIESSRDWHVWTRRVSLAGAVFCGVATLGIVGLRAAEAPGSSPDRRAQGRELFEREWLPGDSRTHGGDGLGPVYNDSSCIACHNLGGNGGAGPVSKNVDIITASPAAQMVPQAVARPASSSFLGKALGSLVGLDAPKPSEPAATVKPAARRRIDTGPLVKAHPGFRTARSVVLHRFGTDPAYETWRLSMTGLGQFTPPGLDEKTTAMMQAQNLVNLRAQQSMQNTIGQFELVRSQRNPTALFGTGLIDAIPEQAIEDAAKVKHAGYPEVAGRVSRLKDKRIGRFGWKAQTASLGDFVLTACAVELGLEVPDRHQGGNPRKPEAQAKGLDLTGQECNALMDYVRALPKPSENRPATATESREIAAGRALFAATGCATCHSPKLGDVEGIYSDLLLHDLGPQLGDVGQYSVFDPSSSEGEIIDEEGPIADSATCPSPDIPAEVVAFEVAVAPTCAVAPTPVEPVPPAIELERVGTPATPQAAAAVVAPPVLVELPNAPTPPVALQPVPVGIPLPPTSAPVKRPTSGPASRFEWRTAPLWGFRDSGPYLHDGRADTLDQAVALHGGESATIAQKFFALSPRERRQVEAFLKSLTAPGPDAPGAR